MERPFHEGLTSVEHHTVNPTLYIKNRPSTGNPILAVFGPAQKTGKIDTCNLSAPCSDANTFVEVYLQ
jgi:hypothetical protein